MNIIRWHITSYKKHTNNILLLFQLSAKKNKFKQWNLLQVADQENPILPRPKIRIDKNERMFNNN